MSKENRNPHNRKFASLTTPLGMTGFASTAREGKFGGYTLDLFLENNDETAGFVKEFTAIHDANVAHEMGENGAKGEDQGVKLTTVKDSDPDIFQEGNYIVLRVKKKSRNVENELLAGPKIYDSNGDLVTLNHEIPIGSSVRVRLTMGSYTMAGRIGTSVYLTAIQVAALGERRVKERAPVETFDGVEGNFVGVGELTEDIGTE